MHLARNSSVMTPPDALRILRTQQLKGNGLKVDLSDGTCIFVTWKQIAEVGAVRQEQTAYWPSGAALEYCCYEGCEFCEKTI